MEPGPTRAITLAPRGTLEDNDIRSRDQLNGEFSVFSAGPAHSGPVPVARPPERLERLSKAQVRALAMQQLKQLKRQGQQPKTNCTAPFIHPATALDPIDPSKRPTAVQSAASSYALIASSAFTNCEEYKSYGVTLFVKKDVPGMHAGDHMVCMMCPICKKLFMYAELGPHLDTAHAISNIECSGHYCRGQNFRTNSYRYHIEQSHWRAYCPLCDIYFHLLSGYKSHVVNSGAHRDEPSAASGHKMVSSMAAAEFGSDKPPPPLTVNVVAPPSMPKIDSVTGSDGIVDLTSSATSPITAENAAATTATMTPKVAVMGDGVVAPSVKEFAVKKKVFHQLQKERAVHKVSPPAVFPLTQAPPDFEPVVWSEFSLFFSADFLEVDGVTYVIKDSVAYKDCPDCGAAYPLPLLRSHIKCDHGLDHTYCESHSCNGAKVKADEIIDHYMRKHGVVRCVNCSEVLLVHEVKQHLKSRCRLKRTTSRMMIPSSIGLDAMRPSGKNLNSDQMRMCTYCGEARAAGADMARHIGLKHEPRARCFQCGQSMAKSLYGQHLIDGHGWSEGNPEGGDRRCRICAVEVDQENSIVEHMEKEHKLPKDVAEQIHSQFHARKHLQKRMVVDVKRMGRSEIRAAIEEQAGTAKKSQQNGDRALSDEEKLQSDDRDGNCVVEDRKEEESRHAEKDSGEPMES